MFSGSATITPCVAVINFQHVKEEERSKTVEAAIAEAEAMQGGTAGWLQKGFRRSSNQTGLTISLFFASPSTPLLSTLATWFHGYIPIISYNTGTYGEMFCFYPSGCMTNLRILPCWFISYLNFCWSASLSLLVLPQFEVLEHLLLVLRSLDNF